jgi:U3 small nucleolar RNA-associated protein MPP10
VRELFDKVCRNLDALSHFYFQPKPVTREAQLTSVATNNVASMSVEDFMPVVESTAAAVAPEQVLGKKHGREVTLLSRDEMTSEDRKALRRAHKASNRKEKNMRKHEEKLVAKMNPGMGNKYEKQKTLDIIRNDKRVTMRGDTGGGKRKNAGNAVGNASEKATSSNMFRQLQDEAKRSIDEKRKKPRV